MILSSQNLGQFLSALDSAQRISEYDAKLLLKIKKLKLFMQKQEEKLKAQRASADALVATLRAKKQAIEAEISAKQKELAKARQELRQLEAEAAASARQAALRQRLLNIVQPSPAKVVAMPNIPASGHGALIVKYAFQELGKPYVWGAAGPNSFDCSGLTMYVFAKVGISLPHSAEAQYNLGQKVSRDSLQPGDLVFFSSGGGYISHVGIYIGNNSYISAPRTGDVVKVQSMNRRGYVGATRL